MIYWTQFHRMKNLSSKQSLLYSTKKTLRMPLLGFLFLKFFIASRRNELNDMKMKLDEMEQYSRRYCLKITGIPEEKDVNTDTLVLHVINSLILKENTEKISINEISRLHRVGKYNPKLKTRDIIVKGRSELAISIRLPFRGL